MNLSERILVIDFKLFHKILDEAKTEVADLVAGRVAVAIC